MNKTADQGSVTALRRHVEDLVERLYFVPLAFVVGSILLSQVTLLIDRQIDADSLPRILETTIDSARGILSTIAGGLIASVTLLLSLTLVALQVASSQFSPRTLVNWIGDRSLQRAIGTVLGTAVFCLLVLRETRSPAEAAEAGRVDLVLVPHVSVLLAVVLGVLSLVMVVRAVGHLADSVRVGSVAERVMASTLETIDRSSLLDLPDDAEAAPVGRLPASEHVPHDTTAIECTEVGWIQRIDRTALVSALAPGSTTWVVAPVGSFSLPGAPLVRTTDDPSEDCVEAVRSAFIVGTTRTMEQDIGYGLVRMVDIAVRALSPGVNDPNTANELIVHLAVVLVRIWELPTDAATTDLDGRRLIVQPTTHGQYLEEAYGPIRRYGAHDSSVAETLIRSLQRLRTEVIRRELPGPVAPIDTMLESIGASIDSSDLIESDKEKLRQLIDPLPPR